MFASKGWWSARCTTIDLPSQKTRTWYNEEGIQLVWWIQSWPSRALYSIFESTMKKAVMWLRPAMLTSNGNTPLVWDLSPTKLFIVMPDGMSSSLERCKAFMTDTGIILTVAPQSTKIFEMGYPSIWVVMYRGLRWWRSAAAERGNNSVRAALRLSSLDVGSKLVRETKSTCVASSATTSPSRKLGWVVVDWKSADKTWTMLISMLSRTEGPIELGSSLFVGSSSSRVSSSGISSSSLSVSSSFSKSASSSPKTASSRFSP